MTKDASHLPAQYPSSFLIMLTSNDSLLFWVRVPNLSQESQMLWQRWFTEAMHGNPIYWKNKQTTILASVISMYHHQSLQE